MPKSASPRRRYNPHKLRSMVTNRPRLDEQHRVFLPVVKSLEALRGEVETMRGYPVFLDWTGEYSRIDQALRGWVDCWERFGTGIDLEPLRKLAKKLEAGIPITEDELDSADRVVAQQQAVFIRMPVEFIKHHTTTELVAIEADRLGLREAA